MTSRTIDPHSLIEITNAELRRRLAQAARRVEELTEELDEARQERDDIRLLLGLERSPQRRGDGRRLGPKQMARRDYARFQARRVAP